MIITRVIFFNFFNILWHIAKAHVISSYLSHSKSIKLTKYVICVEVTSTISRIWSTYLLVLYVALIINTMRTVLNNLMDLGCVQNISRTEFSSPHTIYLETYWCSSRSFNNCYISFIGPLISCYLCAKHYKLA